MTAFFDDLNREVGELSQQHVGDDEGFLLGLALIEQRVIQLVSLVTGDREFPEDLRERILGHIATTRIESLPGLAPTRGREYARWVRRSPLISNMHRDFHEVVCQQITTRFGVLSDDPSGILQQRDSWDTLVK